MFFCSQLLLALYSVDTELLIAEHGLDGVPSMDV